MVSGGDDPKNGNEVSIYWETSKWIWKISDDQIKNTCPFSIFGGSREDSSRSIVLRLHPQMETWTLRTFKRTNTRQLRWLFVRKTLTKSVDRQFFKPNITLNYPRKSIPRHNFSPRRKPIIRVQSVFRITRYRTSLTSLLRSFERTLKERNWK